jgi:hypothetical protein
MSLDTAGWGAAEPSDDVLTQVRDVLAADPSKAYRVRDFFRDAAPSAPEAFDLLNRLLAAVEQRTSRERSEAVAEAALETLVYLGEVKKRIETVEDGAVAYYRIRTE